MSLYFSGSLRGCAIAAASVRRALVWASTIIMYQSTGEDVKRKHRNVISTVDGKVVGRAMRRIERVDGSGTSQDI